MLFSEFLDQYESIHVSRDLRSNSAANYLQVFRRHFGGKRLGELARDPARWDSWLRSQAAERNWANATFNRYYEFGRARFNRAKKWRLVAENPFESIDRRREAGNQRPVRITPDQERKLLECCEQLNRAPKPHAVKLSWSAVIDIRRRAETELQKDLAREFGLSTSVICQIVNERIWNPALHTPRAIGKEMRRRIVAAIDMGLRAGEMLKVQVKHVDYEHWIVRLPDHMTKAGKEQVVFAGTDCVRSELTARRFLGLDAFIFGAEDGRYVASFDKTWKALFRLAGLPVGRKGGFVWHDLRHEYGSYLIEQGGTLQEVKELMRHADITTTARYLKADDERLMRLATSLNKRGSPSRQS
jgi:integrase